jgi:hypothetical protein
VLKRLRRTNVRNVGRLFVRTIRTEVVTARLELNSQLHTHGTLIVCTRALACIVRERCPAHECLDSVGTSRESRYLTTIGGETMAKPSLQRAALALALALAAVEALALGACSMEPEQGFPWHSPSNPSASTCCERIFEPGPELGLCLAGARRGHGPCADLDAGADAHVEDAGVVWATDSSDDAEGMSSSEDAASNDGSSEAGDSEITVEAGEPQCGPACVWGCEAGVCDDPINISAGGAHTCVLLRSGRTVCWGQNDRGQLGAGTALAGPMSGAVLVLDDAAQLSAGTEHTCALRRSGEVVCWGSNTYGQLGNDNNIDSAAPVAVPGLTSPVEISAGDTRTCVREQSGRVLCWGNNPGDSSNRPASVPALANAAEIAAGTMRACGRMSSGSIQCWRSDESEVTTIANLSDAAQISFRGDRGCAVRESGQVVCWARFFLNPDGRTITLSDGNTAVAVDNLSDAVEVSAGSSHACARRISGQVVCWGLNVAGQLGDGTIVHQPAPVPVPGLSDAVEISAGSNHTCARRSNGQLTCWGANSSVQLGCAACPWATSCEDGKCPCPFPQVPCERACADLLQDPNNCGRCGNVMHHRRALRRWRM